MFFLPHPLNLMKCSYNVSKLLLLYSIREIAARSPVSQDSNVITNYMTPGACNSNIFRDDVSCESYIDNPDKISTNCWVVQGSNA
jgi:hypothetical protein